MEIEVSAVFQEFADTHLTGHGLEAYRLQRKEILAFKKPQGHFRRVIKLGGKVLIIEYYLSLKLETLYILAGHLVAAGSKREKEEKIIKEYIAKIKGMEEE
jgi:hypothetical protein